MKIFLSDELLEMAAFLDEVSVQKEKVDHLWQPGSELKL